MSWTPLDDGMLTSTLLKEGPTPVAIWTLILASCDRYGVSKLQPSAAASLLRIPDKEAEGAFRILSGDDKDSRNPAHHGKRIVRTEEGYWAVVSFEKYRKMATKQRAAQRQAAYMERKKAAEAAGQPAPPEPEPEEEF